MFAAFLIGTVFGAAICWVVFVMPLHEMIEALHLAMIEAADDALTLTTKLDGWAQVKAEKIHSCLINALFEEGEHAQINRGNGADD